jgi:hypothetical protein
VLIDTEETSIEAVEDALDGIGYRPADTELLDE